MSTLLQKVPAEKIDEKKPEEIKEVLETINPENVRKLKKDGNEPEANEDEKVEEKEDEKEDEKEGIKEASEHPEESDIIKSLYHRAFSINDKIDHLLFHHNHDVMGKVAQFTPYGIHLVPITKGNNSVD